MKHSRVLVGLLTVALSSPVFADECSDACAKKRDTCLAAPQANHASCAADFAGCVGYNPYAGDNYVEPTACSHTAGPTATPAPNACLQDCQDKYDECIATPGADIPTCDEAVGSCRYTCNEATTTTESAPKPTDTCDETCQDNYTACISGAGSVTSVCDQALTTCKSKCGTKPPTPDTCAADCIKKHDACDGAPGANHATCAAEFAECLGYSPYGDNGLVEPTACSSKTMSMSATTMGPKKSDMPDACALDCAKKHDACDGAPDANHATCAADYAACLGYNPYGGSGFVEPTACSKTSIVTGTTMPGPKKSDMPDACAMECSKKHDACDTAPNANHATCAAEFAECLGYNPYAGNGFVSPTACSKTPIKTGTAMPGPTKTSQPIVVGAGERMQPALALIALGAAVLL